ncbi:dynamin family protein [Gottfriedia luciferensis]|uniref:dynamin family protein n=1 Tax=Gottfriedia luciferensis TaxID=178774 RepID=UPI000B440BB8|nr:dynamin family protein [Gottfriedia luciferensis]
MTVKQQFIKKEFYKSYLNEIENDNHPIAALAELYREQNDDMDLSSIRFAQGEVYFENKDFETAVFKWEKVGNQLSDWAKKNIADSYYEIGAYETAERLYREVKTDSRTLTSEIFLKLFSLYIDVSKYEEADRIIKEAVKYNPDYPNVTKIARNFYEKNHDWNSAVALASEESIRTEDLKWFIILKDYILDGVTTEMAPSYFVQPLLSLARVNLEQFELMVEALWNSYHDQSVYITWLQTFNEMLFQINVETGMKWNRLPSIYSLSYEELVEGDYFVAELEEMMPSFLTNWLRITDLKGAVLATTATLAWDRLFPGRIDYQIVVDAEMAFEQLMKTPDCFEIGKELFENILQWSVLNEIEVGERFEWWTNKITQFENTTMLVAGTAGNGKSSFVNSLLGEKMMGSSTTMPVLFEQNNDANIVVLSKEGNTQLAEYADFYDLTTVENNLLKGDELVHYELPNSFLQKHRLSIIDTPGIDGDEVNTKALIHSVKLADRLVFVLNATAPYTENERSLLVKIHKELPTLPIHFILNKMDSIYSTEEIERVRSEIEAKIREDFPTANVLPYSSIYSNQEQFNELERFIENNVLSTEANSKQTEKLLLAIRKLINFLLEKRVEREDELRANIQWNEVLDEKLNGLLHSLKDKEMEHVYTITSTYRELKDELKYDLKLSVPGLLKECKELIKEDSDFSTILETVNEEMNIRIGQYVRENTLPKLNEALQNWIKESGILLEGTQSYLAEMSNSLNEYIGNEYLNLECDFKVLDDWRRDADRMTSMTQLDDMNILLNSSPSQFILKSSGILLGLLPQNKSKLVAQYQKYVDNVNYDEITSELSTKFFLQFEMFEKTLPRDLSMFLHAPYEQIHGLVDETRESISNYARTVEEMKSNPSIYFDPITFFTVRLRQLEFLALRK